MVPITPPMSRITGIRWRDSLSFCASVMFTSLLGTCFGLSRAQIIRWPLNRPASMRPGNTPATNSLAIDTSAATP